MTKEIMNSEIRTITPKGDKIFKYLNPFLIITHLFGHRNLVKQLVKRELIVRYKGSFLGIGWSFIQPLFMLLVYTFVFSVIFKAKWGVNPNEGRGEFALALFAGIITFGIFSEIVNAAPSMIMSNANFVKKVVFPLEILPFVKILSAVVNGFLGLLVLFVGFFYIHHYLPWTVLLVPLAWFPLILFSLGCAYFLASLGVFIRDLEAAVPIITTMLFFLTPVFYPASAVPERFRIFCMVNPLAIFVEDARRVILWELLPDWKLFSIGLGVSLILCILGFVWFMKSKNAFVDVI